MSIEGLCLYSTSWHRALRLEGGCKAPGRRDDHDEPEFAGLALTTSIGELYEYSFVDVLEEDSPVSPSAESPRSLTISLHPSYRTLSLSLFHKIDSWKSAFIIPGVASSFAECGVVDNILGVIRDAIFARILNLQDADTCITSTPGFWVLCLDSSEAYEFCLRLCRHAFWLRGGRPRDTVGSEDRRIYTIDLSEYSASKSSLNLCYSSCKFVACCCRVCRDICGKLCQDPDLSKSHSFAGTIYEIISQHTCSVLTFLNHNRSHRNLEHQLLSASVDGYLSKCGLREKLDSGASITDEDIVDKVLDDCGCFVLLKSANALFDSSPPKHSGLNHWAMVVDVLQEYTSMWALNDLPIHMFCCWEIDSLDSSADTLLYDVNVLPSQGVDISDYMLGNMSYFRYRVDLIRAAGGEDSQRERFLRRSIPSDGGEPYETLLRYLVSLTSGYGLHRLGLLTRMASCEYMAALLCGEPDSDGCEEHLFVDIGLTARCFEKAVSLSPPVSAPTGMSGLCIIPYSHRGDTTPFSSFPPLSIDTDGTMKVRQGFSSLILREPLRHELICFASGTDDPSGSTVTETPFVLIEGPSGSGKTHLSIALAHELRSTLILVNVLDFLRPQVGASEKLVHEFFTPLLRQYSGDHTSKGGDRSNVRCVVALEGIDCLVEDSAYMRSLLYALCSELSRFRDYAVWNGTYSVLFVFTCENVASIPQRLRELCTFGRQFSMKGNISTLEDTAACFELYLNGRGSLLERFREVWPSWGEDSHISSLRACDIALLCRVATLWSLNHAAASVPSSLPLGRLVKALCTVPP